MCKEERLRGLKVHRVRVTSGGQSISFLLSGGIMTSYGDAISSKIASAIDDEIREGSSSGTVTELISTPNMTCRTDYLWESISVEG